MVLQLVITIAVAVAEELEQVFTILLLTSVKYIYGLVQGLFAMWILLE